MSDISLLTIVRGRRSHLHNLLKGVREQQCKPREVIVVFMNEAIPDELPDPGCAIFLHRIDSDNNRLPVAAARNRAAAAARGEVLAFLDVDCIPHPDYLQQLEHAVHLTQGLVMGDVRYLPEGAADGNWSYNRLEQLALPHPRRPQLPADKPLITLPYHLFWSLTFGIRATDFARLGGFDQKYDGYGGEDTDFAFMARRVRLPFYGCQARVYHQYHRTFSPPYNHMRDIVINATRFHQKWQMWPMEGWLKQFERDGYIDWQEDEITVLREPDAATIDSAVTHSAWG